MQTRTTECECFQPTGRSVNPEILFEGIDTKNSNYGDVMLSKCQHCSTVWLWFFIEYESFGRSGRWYRAPVPAELVSDITAENAIQMLNTLEPRFAGGSHIDSTGFETNALVDLRP